MLNRFYRKASVRFSNRRKLPNLIFLHVPKAGGTSLDRTLEALYPRDREGNIRFDKVTEAWQLAQDFRPSGREDDFSWFQTINTVLSYKIASQAPYLSGHFAVSQQILNSAKDKYQFVTLLREPVARWKSNYIYSRIRLAQDGKRQAPKNIGQELEDYLTSSQAKKEGTKYVRYFGGYKTPDNMGSQECIEKSVTLLSQFDCIGFLENLPEFERRLSELLNIKISVPHLRKTEEFMEPSGRTAGDYKALFTDAVVEKVTEICRPDQEIYQAARALEQPIVSS
ncbi:sulfotransferase family 2 domain-containing protein [Pelagicoccus sp. SDUM812002]|uniref:sulfotransferase family 2 domain-containing protein n=1 Tax=Pelagicoccus sp. SDUM812002 TaxID=3041266 RepID=UPI00280D5FF5|nr:sulfotransferase family 2 domain-containing protein [Pelagicoccus sp. SDUM812002]MDQ8184955.1 sulfotransferase family 2 domain-containing protein [Pelagicoccus sp. SDUM812002]